MLTPHPMCMTTQVPTDPYLIPPLFDVVHGSWAVLYVRITMFYTSYSCQTRQKEMQFEPGARNHRPARRRKGLTQCYPDAWLLHGVLSNQSVPYWTKKIPYQYQHPLSKTHPFSFKSFKLITTIKRLTIAIVRKKRSFRLNVSKDFSNKAKFDRVAVSNGWQQNLRTTVFFITHRKKYSISLNLSNARGLSICACRPFRQCNMARFHCLTNALGQQQGLTNSPVCLFFV